VPTPLNSHPVAPITNYEQWKAQHGAARDQQLTDIQKSLRHAWDLINDSKREVQRGPRMGSEEEISLQAENKNLRRLLAQAGIDAAEHKVAEELQRILMEELHHRVTNTLATVQAITSQSLRTAQNMEHAREAIASRLVALGRVHDLLLRTNWGTTKLASLLKMATEPFDTSGSSQFLIQCANVEVSSGASLPLAMTLNELCTNAVKYGALSSFEGRIQITTKVDQRAKKFRLTWAEKGGPPVKVPAHRSFGMRLIEHSFVNQLQGTARVRFEPTGLICELDVPLTVIEADLTPNTESQPDTTGYR
jgi:two-component sensor histidine kinase